MAAKDIVKHQFKKGQSGNPAGVPLKTISRITREFEKLGYKIPTKKQILDAGLMLMGLPTKLVIAIANEEVEKELYPFYYPSVARDLLSDKGHEIREKILDRALGKATQNTDITTQGEKLQTQFIVGTNELSDEVKGFIDEITE